MKDNIKQAEQEIDEILGDVLEKIDEADAEPELVEENGEIKPNIKKFEKLMEAFDIGEGNMSKNIEKMQNEILEDYKVIENTNVELDVNTNASIVQIADLIADHNLVREALREDINNTRIVLNRLSEQIATADIEDLNGAVTEAYSSIKASQVKSLKLLMDSYNLVSETQLKIKKLAEQLKQIDKEENKQTNIEQAIFIGSPQELLEKLNE